MNNKQKQLVKRCFKRIQGARFDPLQIRASVKGLIEANSIGGRAYVEVWSRDCDLAEGTSLHEIPAVVSAFVKLENDIYDNAEGPTTMVILEPNEVAGWRPYFRDVAAEAAGY